MSHKCFISFKTEDSSYKDEIQNNLNIDMIDKSLDYPISSTDEDYIMRKIREDHLQDSTVTISLIGLHSAENSPLENQSYIKRELQASLYNVPNGVLGIVLPEMYGSIFEGKEICSTCGEEHNIVQIDNSTTIREFNYNYYLPNPSNGCYWSENDRYCLLEKWDYFKDHPNECIDKAFSKRTDPIKSKIKVFPK